MTRIDEIKERLSKATPGPWTYIPDSDSDDWQLYNSEYEYIKQDDSGVPISRENGEFIANAPTDIAYLLRVAEAAEVMRKSLNWNLEIFAKSRFLTDRDSNAHKSIIHDSMDEGFKDTTEALARVKELME